jgi:Uncharacterized protein conserved in bacteria (DUF2188)
MAKRNQHVVPHNGKWAVRGEGNSRVTSTHHTQREAIEAARRIARNQQSELVVHGRAGRIRERDGVGLDPAPPRDRQITAYFPARERASSEPTSAEVRESLEIIEDQELDEAISRDARASGYREKDAVDIVRRYRMEKNNQGAAS